MPIIYSIFGPILLRLQLTQQTLLQWLQSNEIQRILPEVEKQLKDLLSNLVDHFLQKLEKHKNEIDPVKLNEAVGKIIYDFRSASESNPDNEISLKNIFQVLNNLNQLFPISVEKGQGRHTNYSYEVSPISNKSNLDAENILNNGFQVLNRLNKIFSLLVPSEIEEGNKLNERFQVLNYLNDQAIITSYSVYKLTNPKTAIIMRPPLLNSNWYFCPGCYKIFTNEALNENKITECSNCGLDFYGVSGLVGQPEITSLNEQLKINHILIELKSRIILENSLIKKEANKQSSKIRNSLMISNSSEESKDDAFEEKEQSMLSAADYSQVGTHLGVY